MNCNFILLTAPNEQGYNCRVINKLEVNEPNTTITEISGRHIKRVDNKNVDRLLLFHNPQMKFIPVGFSDFFPNLNNFWIENCPVETILKSDFELAKDISTLGIVKSKLKTVDEDVFSALEALENLYLQNNLIEKIHEESFSMLENLKILKLSGNKLSYLPEKLFEGCRNIQEIYFNDNKLKIIEKETFYGLGKITKIQLKGNLCLNKNYPNDFYSILDLHQMISENCGNPLADVINELSETKNQQKLIISKFQAEITQKNETIANLDDEKLKLQKQNKKLSDDLNSIESEKNKLLIEKKEYQNELIILRLNHSEITLKIDEIINQTIEAEYKFSELQRNLTETLKVNEELAEQNFELELNFTNAIDEIADLNDIKLEFQEKLSSASDDKYHIEQDFQELQTNLKSFIHENEQLKVEVLKFQSAELQAEAKPGANIVTLILSGIIVCLLAVIVLMTVFMNRDKFSKTYNTNEAAVEYKNYD